MWWRIFLAVYGIIAVIVAYVMVHDPRYFGQVGFLVVGTLIGIFPAFLMEEVKNTREAKVMTLALCHEVADRVARCCFDFEHPWHKYLNEPIDRSRFDVKKFVPVPPVVYPAVAPKIGLLGKEAAQAVVGFYNALASWERDLENTTAETSAVPAAQMRFLAKRLRQTLGPGDRVLEKLGDKVDNAEEIAKAAIAERDRLFPGDHPNRGKPVRKRIALMLAATKETDS